jgi:hypothetical protein
VPLSVYMLRIFSGGQVAVCPARSLALIGGSMHYGVERAPYD